jgi:hypothetical protein
MNIDVHGFKFWIELDGQIHHSIETISNNGDCELSYENIIITLVEYCSTKSFLVNEYKDNIFIGTYLYRLTNYILKNTPEFVKMAKVFNPEALI